MSVLGDRIKLLRDKHNYSQKRVASALGISNVQLSRYESGDRKPDPEMITMIADYFGVSTDFLLGKTDNLVEKTSNEIFDDPDFQYAMRSAQGFSDENRRKVLEYIEMIEELEKGRKPGDKQPRRKK
ncbi:helix-turn-helix domain-containing protein [Heyndrickxia oleronia]|uniref:helix-turn-helix domain-containing protein n=1 Tax=Heyndrickxia oleronia TaxID=38875 RepID=UPI001C0F2FB3|nr:helix-turn-helix transcriptional regulator [Heyndrickxia oleronia]MBU5213257.1 helix-turn-helix domain-containing protein [Heyndrickxia oleronia]